jgi:hypothetical protein
MRISVWLALAWAVGISLLSVPAHAQATHTWVSGIGDDANPCSRTAPCKTFAGAISKTAPAGEINILDPGGFGAVTITKSITISSDGIEAGVLVPGTNGIVISTASTTDHVILKGLDIEGLGTGLDGIKVLAAGTVYVINCRIHNFTGTGVNMNSNVVGSRLIIKDSMIMQNANGVAIQGNGVANGGTIENTVIDGNTTNALSVNGAGNVGAVVQSILTGSLNGLNLTNGGVAISIGQQNVVTGAGAFTSNVAYK